MELEDYEIEGNSFPNQELSGPLPSSYKEVVKMFGVDPNINDILVSFDLASPEWWMFGIVVKRTDWLRLIPAAYFTKIESPKDLGVAIIPMCCMPDGLQLLVRQRFADDDST